MKEPWQRTGVDILLDLVEDGTTGDFKHSVASVMRDFAPRSTPTHNAQPGIHLWAQLD